MDKIITFSDDQPKTDLETFARRYLMRSTKRECLHRMDPPKRIGRAQEPDHVSVPAEINHGRWIVKCPNPGCTGASFADPKQPVFMCVTCWNVLHGHCWLKVDFPADREVIEREILKRPYDRNRNWTPDESIEAVKEINRAHGVEAEVAEKGGGQ